MMTVQVSVMGMLLAVVASMIIGGVWYSVFAEQWLKALGKKKSQLQNSPQNYALQAVYSLVMAYVLAHFVRYADATTIMDGLKTGFWAWLGFTATTSAGMNLWEGKGWDLWLINNGNYLLTSMAMGAILALY